jgi:hypothetical protein
MNRVTFLKDLFNRSILFLIMLLTYLSATGQGLPLTLPEQVGLSSERLNRIETVMNDNISKGIIPGVVTMVARHGKVAYYYSMSFS